MILRSGVGFCDVCFLSDGRWAFVYNGALGAVVCEVEGGGGWRTVLPAATKGVALWLRSGVVNEQVFALCVGANDRAYRVTQTGAVDIGPAQTQNAVAIDSNGDEYVMLDGFTYAKNGEPCKVPFAGGTSQGFRDVVNGEIRWADDWFMRDAAGARFAQVAVRGDVLIGQCDPGNQIGGVSSGTLFTAIDSRDVGNGYEPHIAVSGDRVAVCARTDKGAALALAPFSVFIGATPTTPTKPSDPTPTEPKKPEPVNMKDISLESYVAAERAKYPALLERGQSAEIMNAVAWRRNQELGEDRWGLSVKPNGNNVPSPQGKPVAYDILHDRIEGQIYGCFTGEERAIVNWGAEPYHNDPAGRPWLAPIAPAASIPATPTTPTTPASGSIDALVASAINKAVAPLKSEIASLRKQIEHPPAPKPGGAFPSRIALRSDHGKYVSAQADGSLVADRDNVGGWEIFSIEVQE